MTKDFTWNPKRPSPGALSLHDETLREGLQCPSAKAPSLHNKGQILRGLDDLGVGSICLSMPAASPRSMSDGAALLRLIAEEKRPITPVFAGRTLPEDIKPIADLAQGWGRPLEATLFIGGSALRSAAEGWSQGRIIQQTREAIAFARGEGLGVTFVTEDTIRTPPALLRPLFIEAIQGGATRICLSDTAGHAEPEGVRALVKYTLRVLEEEGVLGGVGVDWHGHNDRGMALINSLVAWRAGADRLHGTLLGIGERVGNTAMDLLMVNLKLMGAWEGELHTLPELGALVERAFDLPLPPNYPVLGRDAFRTATGVHAAAIIKALDAGDVPLADAIYSGVPASMVGRAQEVALGPMSGAHSLRHWLKVKGISVDAESERELMTHLKGGDGLMKEEDLVAYWRGGKPPVRTK